MEKIYWNKNIIRLKELSVKSICCLVHYKDKKRGLRKPMSPRILRKNDAGYECVRELDFAVRNKDCNNIALTGIYGSGKSSIIKTLLRKHPFKKVLRLSLSRYISKEELSKFNEKEVERLIFQHILFKSKPQNTPQSKYRRIPFCSYKKALFIAFCFLLLILSVLTLWKFDLILALNIKNPFAGSFAHEFITKVYEWKNTIAIACIAIEFVLVFAYIIRRVSKFGIRSFKFNDFSFDVTEDNVDFNKLLEEMLYFLKAGNYNYVIFEDLDRIENPRELFLKFREINLLLNESEYFRFWHKRIVFIYAIRDDVFQEEERTKFFDYIVPVIPVVDHFNASDYLLKNYKSELNEVDDKDIMSLGLYIGGMRQLQNIMNEYGVYKRMILVKPLSQKKLLAMTIYKNLYPKDYSEAHSKKGCLYDVFEKKREFSHILTEYYEKEVTLLNNDIEKDRGEINKQRSFLMAWAKKKGNIKALIINEKRYRLDEILERDDLYQQVESNEVESYIEEEDGREYRKPWIFSFSEIAREFYGEGVYEERMEGLNGRLFGLVSLKNEVQKKIQTISNYSLQNIIRAVNNVEKTLEVATKICKNEENAEVLHTLIRNGYIDDDYKAYLSYTYPGAMTNIDFEFVHSVLQGVPYDYYATLHSFDNIIKAIHTDNFSHKSILNYSLLKYLIVRNDEVRLDLFVMTARETPDFIVSAFLYENINERFFKKIFDGWHHCIRDILKISSESDQKTMLVLFWREAPFGLNLDDGEITYLNNMYGAVCDNLSTINTSAAIKVTHEYNLRFEKIRKPDETSKDLYSEVIEHANFIINAENLYVIYGEAFKTSSYTQVMKGNKNVYNYIKDNIADFLLLVPESDSQESTDAIVELLNNDAIDRDFIIPFVKRQENSLKNLNLVNVDSYDILFESDNIVPSWDSIGTYYSKCPDDKVQIVEYIKRHVDELKESKVRGKELQSLLLADNETLPVDKYEKLAECFEECFDIAELIHLDDSRLKVIVNNGLVEYSKESVDFFKQKPVELLSTFIIHFFSEIENDELFAVSFSNELSLSLLRSELSIEQKKWLLDNKIVINESDNVQELGKLICLYYSMTVMDDTTDVDLIVKAMEVYTDEDSWKMKIELTNAINAAYKYDVTIEERMLNALGGGYLGLNNIGGAPIFFDNNEENRVLLNYLREKGHNVSKIIFEGNRIKVTFRRKK